MADLGSIRLNNVYNVFDHVNFDAQGVTNDDWSIQSYNTPMSLQNFKQFWEFVNNLTHVGLVKHSLFIMRDDNVPIYEDPSNAGGGICSFSAPKKIGLDVTECVCVLVVCNLFESADRIKGIVISEKKGHVMTKIWYSNFKKEFVVPDEIKRRFGRVSIMIRPMGVI
jgi:hypothetical protein